MKKLLLLIILIFASSSVFAEWIELGSTETKTLYFKSDSIRKKKNLVKVWILHNYSNAKEDGTKSEKDLIEINCSEEEMRLLSTISYNQQFGKGTHLGHNYISHSSFSPIVPESAGSHILQKICNKK